MENTLRNLDLIDPWVIKNIIPFCQKMLECLPGRISAICLYGSAAVGDHITKHSDINLMVLVDRLEMEDLKKCLKLIKWGRKNNISAPLLLTPEHIKTSTDTFPTEFLEMKEKHIILYGTDPFPDIVIDPKNLRLQCEQQIKGKLIRIRQAYLELGLKRRELLGLLTSSFTTLLPVLRNSLRLVEPDSLPPKTNEEVILKVCVEFQVDDGPFVNILRIKKGQHKPTGAALEDIFKGYLQNLTKLAKKIDEL